LYGTAWNEGPTGYGLVYEILTSGKEEVLYSFTDPRHGELPRAGVIRDKTGALIGTTEVGVKDWYGVVYKLVP
jgi:uncharacterized repeat protein (TIGR03803 family)